MQQQHWLRETSVAAMMAREPSSAEAQLILSHAAPGGLSGAFAQLPARKVTRQ
jgi:hypothetical protein